MSDGRECDLYWGPKKKLNYLDLDAHKTRQRQTRKIDLFPNIQLIVLHFLVDEVTVIITAVQIVLYILLNINDHIKFS